jgi:hypothetical protein
MESALVKFPADEDPLTPADMLHWLKDEASLVAKAAEMRIREATDLVTAYATGEITAAEANKRFYGYSRRWGDAIYGVSSTEGKTDKQIRKEMDEARDGTWEKKVLGRTRRQPER